MKLMVKFQFYSCYQIPILLEKEPDLDQQGNPVYEPDGKPRYRCGFRIGGGIDQDPSQSPQGYPDKVRFSFRLFWGKGWLKYSSKGLKYHTGKEFYLFFFCILEIDKYFLYSCFGGLLH